MELRQLEAFVAVAEERNFTRAASRLHVAQSGLSATIRTLERDLHAPLFVRTTRTVALTPAGLALLGNARRTLTSARAAVEAVAAVEGLSQGKLTLGIMQSSSLFDLPSILKRFRDAYPGVDLRLTQLTSADAVRLLRDHDLDLIFTTGSDQTPPDLLSFPLVESPLMVVCAEDSVLADRPVAELSLVADQPQIGFPVGWGIRALADRAMQARGLRTNYVIEINDTATVLDLVEAGFGVALVPEIIANLKSSLRRIPLKGRRWTWTIVAETLGPAPPNPAARAMWRMLEDIKG
jgi:DNA-binding transcriptional LysR family regulator